MSNLYKTKQSFCPPNPGKRSRENLRAAAKQLAAESIVLLANNHHFLPVKTGSTAAFFGRSQLDTLIGGAGSGASRNAEQPANILDECRKAGITPVPELVSYYQQQLAAQVVEDPFARLAEAGADLINSGIIYEIFGKYEPPREEFPVPAELSLIHIYARSVPNVPNRGCEKPALRDKRKRMRSPYKNHPPPAQSTDPGKIPAAAGS